MSEELPAPPDDRLSGASDARLWVGNLDSRVTEFALLKLLQKYGHLKKFDFLYHKSGPDQGKPRGYCFASYYTKEVAYRALIGLNGKRALSKKMIVRWAHTDKSDLSESKPDVRLQLLGSASQPVTPGSKESKIHLIEAKLRMMGSKVEEFSLDSGLGSSSTSSISLDNSGARNTNTKRTKNLSSKPYSRTENKSKDHQKRHYRERR